MAYYQDGNNLTQFRDPMFDREFAPGQPVDFTGIYKCVGCDREITADRIFPPQGHHEHQLEQGEVRWKLLVWARDLRRT